MLDLPGIIEGAKDGKGRGRQVIAVARTCSLIFIVLDVLKPLQHKRIIERELEGFGIRLNKTPPNIAFKKKDKGGINLALQVWRKGTSRPLLWWVELIAGLCDSLSLSRLKRGSFEHQYCTLVFTLSSHDSY